MKEKILQENIVENFSTPVANLSIRTDGILIVKVTKNDLLTVEDIQDIVHLIMQKHPGEKFPHLIIPLPATITSYEGLKYLASQQRAEITCADAFVLESLQQKLLFNFYIKFQHPVIPTRSFQDVSTALEWLQQFSCK